MKKLKLTLTIIAALGLVSSASATLTKTLDETCLEISWPQNIGEQVTLGVLVMTEDNSAKISDLVVFSSNTLCDKTYYTATLFSDDGLVPLDLSCFAPGTKFTYISETAFPGDPKGYTHYTPLSGDVGFSSFCPIEYNIGSIGDKVCPVPEPSTYVAGALLLLPFGASTIRSLRKNKAA